MYLKSLGLSALVLACEVSVISAKRTFFEDNVTPVRQREDAGEKLRRDAFQVVDPEIGRRQATSTTAAASAETSGALNFNTPEWNQQTNAACTASISAVQQAKNPAGMIACYNLPFLNTKTGVFSADLRLYQLTTMTGDFTGVSPNQISLSLSYPDASVSETSTSAKIRRQAPSQIPGGNQNELQQFSFVGQIDATLTRFSTIKSNLQMSLLIPTIQLSAPSPANSAQTVSTNLTSVDTVYFVNGVFKGQSAAGATASEPTAQASASYAAAQFVVPGVTFGIFPVGLIVTSVWTVLFVAAVGYGTYGRYKFRQHYRARVARSR